MEVLRKTYSVCPVCLKRLPAVHVAREQDICLEKTCPEHGFFSTVIWRGLSNLNDWQGIVPQPDDAESARCPENCGLCSHHLQDTCCVLLEITKRCNLNCSFCFAEGGAGEDVPFEEVTEHLHAIASSGRALVQLSGGEPTTRDDLPEIVSAAKKAGCQHVQLNTNGIRLAEDPEYVRALADAGLSFVFMQFDGTDDSIYRKLRGRDLFRIKQQAIENCGRHNLGVTLVPTLVPGININNIGSIIRFALSHSPAVRGVHFQPVSYFGRTPTIPVNDMRFTLDQLLKAVEEQAGTLVPIDSLLPSKCNHPLCGFHGDYIVMNDKTLHPLHKRQVGCCAVGRTVTGEQKRSFLTRRWQRPAAPMTNSYPGEAGNQTVYSADEEWADSIDSLDGFLRRARTHSFTITSMIFQDAGNLDAERLRRCSLHVYSDGKFIPFCSYYLTGIMFCK